MRLRHTACEKQGLFNASFALVHGDPIAQRGFVFDDPRGEMRHDGKPFACDTLGSGHHVFDCRAFDMGNIHARCGRQKLPKICDFLSRARHHLD